MKRMTVMLLAVLAGCGAKPEPSPAPSVSPATWPSPIVSEGPAPAPTSNVSPHPAPSPTRPPPFPSPRPFPPLWPQEDPGCVVLKCNGDCVVTEVRSERSGTLATWSFCVQYPPERVGPPPGWRR